MAHTDLVAPSAQSEGRVSEPTTRLVERIYHPNEDKSGQAGVKQLRAVVAATRSLQRRSTGRYIHRKAAGRMKGRRPAKRGR
jgi:hypothetical protein